MPLAHSWTLLWQPKDRCSDTRTLTCTHKSGATFWAWCLYVRWGGMIAEGAIIPWRLRGVQRWESEERMRRRRGQKRMKPSPLPYPPPPPGSTLWVTRQVLTFGIHQVHHNILLALVKRELAWEVEAFFALYFDRLLVSEWMKNEWGGGRREVGGGKGRGPWKGKKTKTEWDSMRTMDTHAEQKQMELNKNHTYQIMRMRSR